VVPGRGGARIPRTSPICTDVASRTSAAGIVDTNLAAAWLPWWNPSGQYSSRLLPSPLTAYLGYRPADKPHKGKRYVGRRIGLLQPGLKVAADADPVEAVRGRLQSKGENPRWLRQKAVVGIAPKKYLGRIIWPM
jgi:hypothetical protein